MTSFGLSVKYINSVGNSSGISSLGGLLKSVLLSKRQLMLVIKCTTALSVINKTAHAVTMCECVSVCVHQCVCECVQVSVLFLALELEWQPRKDVSYYCWRQSLCHKLQSQGVLLQDISESHLLFLSKSYWDTSKNAACYLKILEHYFCCDG